MEQAGDGRQLLITASQVLRGPRGEQIRDGAVLVEAGTIVVVGPRRTVEQQAQPTAVHSDYPGCTVLPGLINCHVHLAFDGGPDLVSTVRETPDDALLDGMAKRARQLLYSGVTTVRDLGDRDGLAIHLRDRVNRGKEIGPRIVAAGPPITPPRGHCWFLGGEAEGEQQLRQRVQHNADMGADVIKVMASGGQITPNSPPMWQTQFTENDLKIVVDQASRLRLPVAAHAHGTHAIQAAVNAGVATIEHCTWLQDGGGGYDTQDAVARTMAERGIYACVAWPPDWQGFMARLGAERADMVVNRFQWMARVGIPLIPGTDAGLPRSGFTDFAEALKLYTHVGYTADQVIEMATTTSAQALGLNRVGQITAGHSADILIVEGDPTTNLDSLSQRQEILMRGIPTMK
ncbi:amidohydrolase family protein [Amycolatopsis umgeniensis]|nr:amidohydrolase family protein [Amycolatopsis umgeniensis]